jgi:subtilisin family serine protease
LPAAIGVASVAVVLGLVVPSFGGASGGSSAARSGDANVIDGSYIVVYKDSRVRAGARTAALESELGFRADYIYAAAIDGFAARLNGDQLRAVESDPSVDFVSENRRLQATDNVPLAPGEPKPPTGTRRIKSATNTTARQKSTSNVAVIDTGIKLNHADLNAAAGKDCIDPGTSPVDGHGHGTHVAGTIGALNNGAGVVGVAPGTLVYAVRVLDDGGNGTSASVICGINYVKANHASKNIDVANMSLSGLGPAVESCATTTDAMHKAICQATNAGVNFVVAAGNEGWDFDFPSQPDLPAAYPQVLTVTAMADSDGKQGGTGPNTSCGSAVADDTRAGFSNFALTNTGRNHTIAAPGVCIKSTWKGTPNYNTISGTSMASPHMAAVVALCLGEQGLRAGFLRRQDAGSGDLVPAHGRRQLQQRASRLRVQR